MNMIPMLGFRAVYTTKEVAHFLGMTIKQVQWHAYKGRLRKRGCKTYPYLQRDVNEFIVKLNNGEMSRGLESERHV